MGSSGSGRFGTYHVNGSGDQSGSKAGGVGGVRTGEIECPKLIENIRLEDVTTSEYYVSHQSLPAVAVPVQLRNIIYNGRLVIEIVETKEILGNLPTQYNHLVNCIKKGINYTGTVIASGEMPIAFVVVTLYV